VITFIYQVRRFVPLVTPKNVTDFVGKRLKNLSIMHVNNNLAIQ